MVGHIAHLVVFLIAALALGDLIYNYVKSTGTVWQRLLAAGKGTATILWARFAMIVTGISDALVALATFLNEPGVAPQIQAVLQPQYVAAFVIGTLVITEIARRRTL